MTFSTIVDGVKVTAVDFMPEISEWKKFVAYVYKHMPKSEVRNLVSVTVAAHNGEYDGGDIVTIWYTVGMRPFEYASRRKIKEETYNA